MCTGHHLQRELLLAVAQNNVQSLRILLSHTRLPLSSVFRWANPKTDETQIRTLLMVAAHQGCAEACLELLLAGADVNQQAPLDGYTALHSAVEGARSSSPAVVELLLKAGARSNLADVYGRRPVDLVSELMCCTTFYAAASACCDSSTPASTTTSSEACCSSSSSQQDAEPSTSDATSSDQPSDLDKEEYRTDDFRIFSFKVAECPREDTHDWTECPFAHPGEKARRRDPRVFTYNGTACPDFRKGTCKRGDACPYAHGVFECWLHPSKYRTQLCKDGTACTRRVCFFAHTLDELRAVEEEAEADPAVEGAACCTAASDDGAAACPCTPPQSTSPPLPSPSSAGASSTCSDRSMVSACSGGSLADLDTASSSCSGSVRASLDDFSDARSDVSTPPLSASPSSACVLALGDDVCSARPTVSYGPIGGPIHYSAAAAAAAAAFECGAGLQQQPSFAVASFFSSTAEDSFSAAAFSNFSAVPASVLSAPPTAAPTNPAPALSWLPFASNVVAPHLCNLAHLL